MCNWTKRHSNFTKNFKELTFKQQASAITAMLNNIQRAVNAHCKHPEAKVTTRNKCIQQTQSLVQRIGGN